MAFSNKQFFLFQRLEIDHLCCHRGLTIINIIIELFHFFKVLFTYRETVMLELKRLSTVVQCSIQLRYNQFSFQNHQVL